MPFFSWIILECLPEGESATEAIICYPAYKEGSNEKCFYTSNLKLTKMFYSIVKDFTEEKSIPIKKQESKEPEHLQLEENINNKNENSEILTTFFEDSLDKK